MRKKNIVPVHMFSMLPPPEGDWGTALADFEKQATGRNAPTPMVFTKSSTMPDVSPYDYFDVIHLFYDDQRVLTEWQPIVIKP